MRTICLPPRASMALWPKIAKLASKPEAKTGGRKTARMDWGWTQVPNSSQELAFCLSVQSKSTYIRTWGSDERCGDSIVSIIRPVNHGLPSASLAMALPPAPSPYHPTYSKIPCTSYKGIGHGKPVSRLEHRIFTEEA